MKGSASGFLADKIRGRGKCRSKIIKGLKIGKIFFAVGNWPNSEFYGHLSVSYAILEVCYCTKKLTHVIMVVGL